MTKRNIFGKIMAVVSPVLAVISAVLMVIMFIGIVTFRFNIMALAVLFIFAIFGYIVTSILSEDDSEESYEKTGN